MYCIWSCNMIRLKYRNFIKFGSFYFELAWCILDTSKMLMVFCHNTLFIWPFHPEKNVMRNFITFGPLYFELAWCILDTSKMLLLFCHNTLFILPLKLCLQFLIVCQANLFFNFPQLLMWKPQIGFVVTWSKLIYINQNVDKSTVWLKINRSWKLIKLEQCNMKQ
jgi:hypothetical protein